MRIKNSMLINSLNFGQINSEFVNASGGCQAVNIIGESNVEHLLNYGDMFSKEGYALQVAGASSVANFVVLPDSTFGSEKYFDGIRWKTSKLSTLKKLVFGGNGDNGFGQVDKIEELISGNMKYSDFTGLKRWKVGANWNPKHDGDGVVWQFGGDGSYGKVANAVIEISRSTAQITSSNGMFGESFNSNNGRVLINGHELLT